MAWKTKEECWINGKRYISGIIISSKERPILDHHTDERHWDQFLIEVKDNPAPAPKPATIGSLAKSLIKAVK